MTLYYKAKLNTKSKKVAEALKAMAGTYRKIWNFAIDFQEAWIDCSLSYKTHFMTTARLYKALIDGRDTRYPFVRHMDGGMIKAVSLRANESFKRWFNNYPLSTEFRSPRYLSRKKDNMFFKTQGNVRIFNDYIEIPKLGKVKLYEKGYLPTEGTYSNMTFSYDGNDWWLSFEIKNQSKAKSTEELSGETTLDFNKEGEIVVGGVTLQNAVNGETYKRLSKKQRKLEKKLKRQSIANIQLSTKGAKTRTSRNMLKTKQMIAKVKARLKDLRTDSFKKQASDLARTKLSKLHCLSSLAIKQSRQAGLTRTMREKHTLDFLNIIRKRVELEGTEVVTTSSLVSAHPKS